MVDERDEDGHRLVVGNGRARPRVVATGAGPIEVEAPRVNDKRIDEATGERCRPPGNAAGSQRDPGPVVRKSPKVSEVLPLMYLHGMSSGDFAPALAALPKSVHPSARRAMAEIRDAEDRAHAEAAIRAFAEEFGAKWPKAAAKIVDDTDVLVTFFDFPVEHWLHLKTTNPIESTFATVRLRTKVTRDPAAGPPAWPWSSS